LWANAGQELTQADNAFVVLALENPTDSVFRGFVVQHLMLQSDQEERMAIFAATGRFLMAAVFRALGIILAVVGMVLGAIMFLVIAGTFFSLLGRYNPFIVVLTWLIGLVS